MWDLFFFFFFIIVGFCVGCLLLIFLGVGGCVCLWFCLIVCVCVSSFLFSSFLGGLSGWSVTELFGSFGHFSFFI